MDKQRSELQDSTIPRCLMHDSGLHCRCLDTQDACCDCTAHVCPDGEVRVICEHCDTEADVGSYNAMNMVLCNTKLDDDVGFDECNLVLCETCADNPATDCSEIAREMSR